MTGTATAQKARIVSVRPGNGGSGVVVVCEHASAFIPEEFAALGLSDADRLSHAAWDPGALAVADALADTLGGALVQSHISRLVYDCNRPPDAPDAMPAQSERVVVPGNAGLDAAARVDRVRRYYEPFRAALAGAIAAVPAQEGGIAAVPAQEGGIAAVPAQEGGIAAVPAPVLVTVHSFTPVFHGAPRSVEIGVLHDSDARLADAMLACAAAHTPLDVRRNAPYGPEDRVTHTLREHALAAGHLNVMLEIRNDLIATPGEQVAMAAMLSGWLGDALTRVQGGQDA